MGEWQRVVGEARGGKGAVRRVLEEGLRCLEAAVAQNEVVLVELGGRDL